MAALPPSEIAEVVFKHVAKVESAAIINPNDLVLLHNNRPKHSEIAQFSIRCTPSLQHLRGLISDVRANRAKKKISNNQKKRY